MNLAMLWAVLGVLSAWGIVLFSIWRWGPGRAKHSVLCPEKQLRAKLVVEQREGDFGSLRANDVAACSLFPEGPLNCNKECLARL